MVNYLIACRSLTYAQRTESALAKAGIHVRTMRAPKGVDSEGCGYAVRVQEKDLTSALVVLARTGLTPKRIFILAEDGSYREVAL